MRPAEVMETRGDSTKAREQLGWVPEITFDRWSRTWSTVEIRRVESGVEHSLDYVPARS